MSVSGIKFAEAALERLHLGITYEQEMCDAFVERTLQFAGGVYKNYAGTNTMFRQVVTDITPLDEAIKKGLLQPGWVLFIHAFDGREPDQFKKDGIGNAKHIGIYTGMTDPKTGKFVEVVHSSETMKGVAASTLKNAWTHAAKYPGVSYDGTSAEESMEPMITVASSGNTVNLRPTPSRSGSYVDRIPLGTIVSAKKHNAEWHFVNWEGKQGYIMSEFLAPMTLHPEPSQPEVQGDMIVVDRRVLEAVYLEIKAMLGV